MMDDSIPSNPTIIGWLAVWFEADAITINHHGMMLPWYDDAARNIYMRALIPSREA